jgi:HEAT repeat protein
MIDKAFAALATYDWGDDVQKLSAIEQAVVTTRDDPAARQELEDRLIAVLQADVSRDAKDYVCRKLRVVGTAAAVPALAELLSQEENSHMARYALERIPDEQAAQALREALSALSGKLKIGVIASLGARPDPDSVKLLAGLLDDSDTAVASAAAQALGAIRTPEAAAELIKMTSAAAEVQLAVTDATLACAEAQLAAGQKARALALYKSLAGGDHPKHIRLAATRGMLACAGKSE